MSVIANWNYGGYSGTVNDQGQLILDNGVDSKFIFTPKHGITIRPLNAKVGTWTDTGQILMRDGSIGRWLKVM